MAFDLASITRGPQMTPPRLIVYGPHGLGKTTLIAEAPAPILLPTEDGKGKIDIASFPLVRTWADVVTALASLRDQPHEFGTVGLDSLDWLEPMVWTETCRRNGWVDIEVPGFGKGYTAADDVWREFFQLLSDLRDRKGMQVILTAHTQVKPFNDPSSEPYDRYSIKLQARASAIAQEWADAVLFLNQKSYIQKDKKGAKGFETVIARGVGLGERVLYTEERPSHLAKNRYGLPPEIAIPKGASYSTLAKHLFS